MNPGILIFLCKEDQKGQVSGVQQAFGFRLDKPSTAFVLFYIVLLVCVYYSPSNFTNEDLNDENVSVRINIYIKAKGLFLKYFPAFVEKKTGQIRLIFNCTC